MEEGYWASGAPYRLGNPQAGSFWGSEGSQSPHTGVRGHPSAQVGAEVLGKEAPRDGGPVAPLLGPLGGHSLGTLAEPPWAAFWHLGLCFCSQNEGVGVACRLHSSPPGGSGRHLVLPLDLRTERCQHRSGCQGLERGRGDCWWGPGLLWEDSNGDSGHVAVNILETTDWYTSQK